MEKLKGFREISPYETENALKLIGKDYMLITIPDKDGANAMTASWGCMGVLWNKPVAVCFIRPQRYSFGLAEESDHFSLAFFGSERRDAMMICGKQSGRDIDKMTACGFTLGEVDGVPVISDASLLLVCKKLYADDLKENCFVDRALLDNYKACDYHRMYILEIQKTLVRQ